MSLVDNEALPEIGQVQAADIFRVYGDQLNLELWFVGSEHGLASRDNIDACAVSDGRLIISVDRDFETNGQEFQENDLIVKNLDQNGNPYGDWELFMDGDTNLLEEDIIGLWISYYGDPYLTFDWSFSLPGDPWWEIVERDEVVKCIPQITNGIVESCAFERFSDGAQYGFVFLNLDSLHFDS